MLEIPTTPGKIPSMLEELPLMSEALPAMSEELPAMPVVPPAIPAEPLRLPGAEIPAFSGARPPQDTNKAAFARAASGLSMDRWVSTYSTPFM